MANQVMISGKSVAQAAHELAREILFDVEKKAHKDVTREEYLETVQQYFSVLNGNPVPEDVK